MPGLRNARSAPPIDFPSTDPEWELGQTTVHYALCAALRSALSRAVRDKDFVATDLFVYFDPDDPHKKCAPDGFVKLGAPRQQKDVWRTWLDGIPELCIEVLSSSDREVLPLSEKIVRYTILGTNELVTFDPNAPVGRRLRAWDRHHHTLIERAVSRERTPCRTLDLWFVVAPALSEEGLEASNAVIDALRLARDPDGRDLILTSVEQTLRERADKDAALLAAELERKTAEHERKQKDAALKAAQRERKTAERERKQKDAALKAAERERKQKDAALKAAERERKQKDAALAEIERLRARLADESTKEMP